MKKLFMALVVLASFGASAGTCLMPGYTNADVAALSQNYEAQTKQIIADRDYAILHTDGATAEEKNAQVYAIITKANQDLELARQAYLDAYNAMTYTCN